MGGGTARDEEAIYLPCTPPARGEDDCYFKSSATGRVAYSGIAVCLYRSDIYTNEAGGLEDSEENERDDTGGEVQRDGALYDYLSEWEYALPAGSGESGQFERYRFVGSGV